jgi:hypothetical protein
VAGVPQLARLKGVEGVSGDGGGAGVAALDADPLPLWALAVVTPPVLAAPHAGAQGGAGGEALTVGGPGLKVGEVAQRPLLRAVGAQALKVTLAPRAGLALKQLDEVAVGGVGGELAADVEALVVI